MHYTISKMKWLTQYFQGERGVAFPTHTIGKDWWGLQIEGPYVILISMRQCCCEDEDYLAIFQVLDLTRRLQLEVIRKSLEVGDKWKNKMNWM